MKMPLKILQKSSAFLSLAALTLVAVKAQAASKSCQDLIVGKAPLALSVSATDVAPEVTEMIVARMSALPELVKSQTISIHLIGVGMSNSAAEVTMGTKTVVVRYPSVKRVGEDANADAEAKLTRQVGKAGAGPKVFSYDPVSGAMVMEKVKGERASDQNGADPEFIRAFGKNLKRLHAKVRVPVAPLDIYNTLDYYLHEAETQAFPFPHEATELKLKVDQIQQSIGQINSDFVIHGDLNKGNIFVGKNNSVQFIDWGSARRGDAFYDLASATSQFHFDEARLKVFLESYLGRKAAPADFARLRLNQLLYNLHCGMWCFQQAGQPGGDRYLSAAKMFLRNALSISEDPQFKTWVDLAQHA